MNLEHSTLNANPSSRISFMPRDTKAYQETIPFQINGLYIVQVQP